MNTTNNQLEQHSIILLKRLIGKELEYLLHEEFSFVTVSYGYIYFVIDGVTYALSDLYENKNILGYDEEISVLKFNEYTEEPKSQFKNGNLNKLSIHSKITNITLVNTNTTIISNTSSNSLLDTHVIIFTLEDDYQFSFEKDDYGENISIERGYNLTDKFLRIKDELLENFDKELNPKVELEFINL